MTRGVRQSPLQSMQGWSDLEMAVEFLSTSSIGTSTWTQAILARIALTPTLVTMFSEFILRTPNSQRIGEPLNQQ